MTKEGTAKPFLRWAGGKSRLLPEIRKQYPKTIKRYVEPFIGGGAVLFDILSSRCPEEVCINDANKELAHIYSTVRDYPEELIRRLGKLEEEFLRLDTDRRKEYYTIRRSRFNELIRVPVLYAGHEMLMEKASLMVFLNRTCFNGLWRVNKNGGFNVPVGSYKNLLSVTGETYDVYPSHCRVCLLPARVMKKWNMSSERTRSYIWIHHTVQLPEQVLRHIIQKRSTTKVRYICVNLPGAWLKKVPWSSSATLTQRIQTRKMTFLTPCTTGGISDVSEYPA